MHKRTWWRGVAVLALLAVSIVFPVLSWAEGSWSLPLNLSSSEADTGSVSLVTDGSGTAHVVWSEAGEVYHRYKDGENWTDADLVSSGRSPRLAADAEGNIHLAFASSMAGASDIYYTVWQAGSGWGMVNVSQSAEYSFGPAIAVSTGGMAIVWSEPVADANLIYLAESADGLIWSSGPVPEAEGTGAAVGWRSGESLVVAWEDVYDEGLALEIWAAERTSEGWSLPTDVSYTPLTNSSFPSLTAGPAGLILAWEQGCVKGSAVFAASLTDAGWSEGQEVSAGYPAFTPMLTQDKDGNVHLAWATADAVRYRRWDAGQGMWGPAYTVTTGLSDVSAVGLAVDEEAHVTWLAEAAAGNRDAFYSTRSVPTVSAYLCLPLINR